MVGEEINVEKQAVRRQKGGLRGEEEIKMFNEWYLVVLQSCYFFKTVQNNSVNPLHPSAAACTVNT